jgi:hypothetical protein
MSAKRQPPRRDREFLVHYARVLIFEASARRGTPNAINLLERAGKARREAMTHIEATR